MIKTAAGQQENIFKKHNTATRLYVFHRINEVTVALCFCNVFRSDTPLIYKAVPSWFVRVEHMVEKLLDNNGQCYW